MNTSNTKSLTILRCFSTKRLNLQKKEFVLKQDHPQFWHLHGVHQGEKEGPSQSQKCCFCLHFIFEQVFENGLCHLFVRLFSYFQYRSQRGEGGCKHQSNYVPTTALSLTNWILQRGKYENICVFIHVCSNLTNICQVEHFSADGYLAGSQRKRRFSQHGEIISSQVGQGLSAQLFPLQVLNTLFKSFID